MALLVAMIYLTVASVRLRRICDNWEYYNYPYLEYGSQFTFAELVRYAFWFKSGPAYSSEACINKLRQIDGAIQQWAMENNLSSEDRPTWAGIKPYLGYADTNHPPPCCPA